MPHLDYSTHHSDIPLMIIWVRVIEVCISFYILSHPISGVEMRQSLIESCLFYEFIPFHYISILSLLLSLHRLIAGLVVNQSIGVCDNELVNDRDEWSMEMDVRSEEKEKRTLHWFVNGKQQKGFIKGVPDRVEFGV